MKKLRVHGTKPNGHPFPIVSWGIRLMEWSDISHVVVELDDNRVYHAHFNSVRFENKEDWLKSAEIVHTYEFEIPQENYNAMLEWCEDYKGEKSGYFAKLFGVILPHLARSIFGIFLKNTFAKGMEKNAICSELIRFLALRFWSFTVPALPHPENFTTKDLLEMVDKNGAKKIK